MKQLRIVAILICTVFWAGCHSSVAQSFGHSAISVADDGPIGRAFKNRASNVQVEGTGIVTRLLADDLADSKHQRFIVRLASGQTLLIAHNIDIAPRVADLQKGDTIDFYGEYVWNDLGGMIHWTHHDPQGKHVAGWIKHKGRTYQ